MKVRSIFLIAATGLALGLIVGLLRQGPGGAEGTSTARDDRGEGVAAQDAAELPTRDLSLMAALPEEWAALRPVWLAGYFFPAASAVSLSELDRWVDGAAVVRLEGVSDTVELFSERRQATEEDVVRFEEQGKSIQVGQEIGAVGIPLTRFDARVEWLDGSVEKARVVFFGGPVGSDLVQASEVPLPAPGKTYLLFLRRTDQGLVAEALQFDVDSAGTVAPRTFASSPISQQLAGQPVDQLRPELAGAFTLDSALSPRE